MHEHFNILGLLPYRAVEKRLSFQLGVPTSLMGTFTYKDFTIKTQVGYNYLLAADDSHMDTLDALTRLKIRPRCFTPKLSLEEIIHLAY